MAMKIIFPAVLALLLQQPVWAADDFHVQTWRGGAKAAYTIAHDDYCVATTGSVDKAVVPLLQARGLVASIGIIAGPCTAQNWQSLKTYASAGFELFNHTFSHVGVLEAGTLLPVAAWENQREIGRAQKLIIEQTGYTPHFLAMPADLATDEVKAFVRSQPDFLGMRAAKAVYDGAAAGVNDAAKVDPLFVRWDMYWRDGKWSLYKPVDGSILIQHVDTAIARGDWSYQTMHGVADQSFEAVPLDEYRAYADYLQAKVKAGQLWVAGPTEVLRYAMTRQHCLLQLQGGQLALAQADPLCSRYATVLTVDLSAKVAAKGHFSQNGRLLKGIQLANGGWRVDFNPLAGALKLE